MIEECKRCEKLMNCYISTFEKYYYNPDTEDLIPAEYKVLKKFECPKCHQTETYRDARHYNEAPPSSKKVGLCPFCKEPIRYLIVVQKLHEFHRYEKLLGEHQSRGGERRYYCPECRRLVGIHRGDHLFEFPDLIGRIEWDERSWRDFCETNYSLLEAIRTRNFRKMVEVFRVEPLKETALRTLKLFLSPEDYAKFLSLVL